MTFTDSVLVDPHFTSSRIRTWNPDGSVVLDQYSFHSDTTTTGVNAPPTSGLHTTVIVESTVDHTLNPGGTTFENDQFSEKTDIVDYV